MEETLSQALEVIIKDKLINIVFQPIVSLRDGKVLGYESLSRTPSNNIIKNPEILYETATKNKVLFDLESISRQKTINLAKDFILSTNSYKLFLNVNTNIVDDPRFERGFTHNLMKEVGIKPSRIVFEITERNEITDMDRFKEFIAHYKNHNFQIAIDDAGAGYSGLNLISDLEPHYVKLDMKLIRDIDTDSLKHALVKGMVELSKVSNIYLIAEGIETEEELNALIKLGVQYGQGYFIQRPDEKISDINPFVLSMIKEFNFKKNLNIYSLTSNLHISHLASDIDCVSPEEKVSMVYHFLKGKTDSIGICVLEDEKIVGIVTREKLFMQLSGLYGFTLNQNKKISQLMDRNFLAVDAKTPISVVSTLAMERPKNKLYDFIVITKNDRYMGTVTIKDLLQKTTEIEVSVAKHQNPLTGLPGNLIINQKIQDHIEHVNNYSVAYIDIDNFKAFNDVYGFEKGDTIIQLLADIIRRNIDEKYFVGHIGGDDFTIIIDKLVDSSYFLTIKDEFEKEILKFYTQEDREDGFISSLNRHEEIEKYPLLSITIVGVNSKEKRFENSYDLTEWLSRKKTVAKQIRKLI